MLFFPRASAQEEGPHDCFAATQEEKRTLFGAENHSETEEGKFKMCAVWSAARSFHL